MVKSSFFNSSFKQRSIILFKEGQCQKKDFSDTLMLTSLIDAFSILVIYLLMSFSSSGDMSHINAGVTLPKAQTIERLDRYPIVQIQKDHYLVEDQKVDFDGIVTSLISLKKNLSANSSSNQDTITLQADKKTGYAQISSLIQACSHAGFSNIKFAVLGE